MTRSLNSIKTKAQFEELTKNYSHIIKQHAWITYELKDSLFNVLNTKITNLGKNCFVFFFPALHFLNKWSLKCLTIECTCLFRASLWCNTTCLRCDSEYFSCHNSGIPKCGQFNIWWFGQFRLQRSSKTVVYSGR